ncbi:MAG: hypothetical protein AB1566_08195 [Chloroflexota bacterium]
MQAVPLNEYLDDDNLQTIVERKLQLATTIWSPAWTIWIGLPRISLLAS